MKTPSKTAEAQMWMVVACSSLVQLLLAADWVGFI
jgi:hypothetical protein